MLQGQRDLAEVSSMILSELAPLVSAQHGVFYSMTTPPDGSEPVLELQAGYGFEERKHLSTTFRVGEGLVGQCAKEKKRDPAHRRPGDYVRINSGLGASPPLNIIVLPVLFEGAVRAVVELASFSPFSATHQAFLEQLPESIGLTMNTIEANTLTENLLRQSQSQAEELRSQQEELRESNEDLERQAGLLAEQNIEAEQQEQEIEQSKRLVEEKAGQLAVSSKYKSEFIANMSHELRTPLNSLLILAEQLDDNPDHNMTETQVEYASVILASGRDLLGLLNSILDLAKVESGTVTVEHGRRLDRRATRRSAPRVRAGRPGSQGSASRSTLRPTCPTTIVTDPQRLRQILKNLIANAFKFTERGDVSVRIGLAERRLEPGDRSRWPTAPSVHRVQRSRHRYRHREDSSSADLRGIRAGRRHDGPALRRDRARAVDQPRARRHARRRDRPVEHARRGQHVHRLPPVGPVARPSPADPARAGSPCPPRARAA